MCKECQKLCWWVIILCFTSCMTVSQSKQKINGISFVASGDRVTQKNIAPVVKLNANYAAIMPFGYVKNLNHPTVVYDTDRQWFGESVTGVKQYIRELHKNNIQVMLKPQLWVSKGEFTGNINMTSEADWEELENTYENFILKFVTVAIEENVTMFCIGTELEQFVKYRPEFWQVLIKKIRAIYTGKLTYAANWDEYQYTPFWAALDYIGVDGYFPLSDEKTPEVTVLKAKWQPHKLVLKKYSDSLHKKVVFTEYGYRSVDYTAAKPWDVDYNKTSVNLQGQINATKALFSELWKEDWFAGGFVWKWFINHEKVGGTDNPRFTPQNKPVEAVIRAEYKRQ